MFQGALGAIGNQLLSQALGLATAVLLTRSLPKVEVGLYNLGLSIVTFAAQATHWGLGISLSIFSGEDSPQQLNSAYRKSLRLTILTGIIFSLLLLLFRGPLALYFDNEGLKNTILVLLPIVITQGLLNININFSRVKLRPYYPLIFDTLLNKGLVVLGCLTFILFNAFSISLFLKIVIFAALVSAFVGTKSLWEKDTETDNTSLTTDRWREYRSVGLYSFLGSLLLLLGSATLDRVIISKVIGLEELASYSIGALIGGSLGRLGSTGTAIFAVQLASRYLKTHGHKEAHKLTIQLGLLGGAITLILAFIMYLITPFILSTFFGTQYLNATPVVLTFLAGSALNSWLLSYRNLLDVHRWTRATLYLNILAVTICFISAYPLTKHLGILGTAIAVQLTDILINVFSFFLVKYRFRNT